MGMGGISWDLMGVNGFQWSRGVDKWCGLAELLISDAFEAQRRESRRGRGLPVLAPGRVCELVSLPKELA